MRKIKINLDEKYQIERDFHDLWAKTINPNSVRFLEAFESPTAVENRFTLSLMGNIKNKKILDLGCGMGDATLYFATLGAKVWAIDISPGMIQLVKKLAYKHKFEKNIHTKVMVAENLKFKENSFDIVFGNGILHHAVSDLALKEVYRVLEKGGKAVFIEPLAHNILINIYRKLASKVRTPTEKPFKYPDLNKLTKINFKNFYHREFHFFTLLIFIWYFLVKRVSPNDQRYWKKIVEEGTQVQSIFAALHRMDKILLRYFPFTRRYFWNTVLVYIK